MTNIVVQLLVAGLIVVTAGLRSLRFDASGLTDFELNRRVKAGDDLAKTEAQFRGSRALVDALRRVAVLLLTVTVVVILGSFYNFVFAIVMACGWLLLMELLSSRGWFAQRAEKIANAYRPQIVQAARSLAPALQFLADNRALGAATQGAFYSKEELEQEIEHDSSVLNRDEKLLIRQALKYQGLVVGDIMTPRSVVTTVELGDTMGPLLLDRLHKSGHSRFPVIDGDLDHVRGVLYIHNLVPLDPKIKKVDDAMDPKVFYVHQDKSLDHVLQAFLRTKHHLFMVVNEFEEIVGVVSIEDVLEVIIGRKIVDEFDRYEDLRAVAKLAADKQRKARATSGRAT